MNIVENSKIIWWCKNPISLLMLALIKMNVWSRAISENYTSLDNFLLHFQPASGANASRAESSQILKNHPEEQVYVCGAVWGMWGQINTACRAHSTYSKHYRDFSLISINCLKTFICVFVWCPWLKGKFQTSNLLHLSRWKFTQTNYHNFAKTLFTFESFGVVCFICMYVRF